MDIWEYFLNLLESCAESLSNRFNFDILCCRHSYGPGFGFVKNLFKFAFFKLDNGTGNEVFCFVEMKPIVICFSLILKGLMN